MKYSYMGITATLMLLPFSLILNISFVLPALVAYSLWLLVTGKKGYTFVVMAFSMCIAYSPGLDDVMSDFMADMFRWVYRSIYLFLLVSTIFVISKRKYYKSGIIMVSSILYILVSSIYGMTELVSGFYKLLLIPLFFNACYAEKLSMEELINILTVLFVGVGGYAILDFFFEVGPYMVIYQGSKLYEMEGLHRANGLLGNSLSLSAVAAGFYVVLLIKWYLKGNADWGKLAFCMVLFMTTGSRTSIVVAVAVFLVYMLYVQRNVGKVVQVGISAGLGIILLIFLAFYFLPEHIEIMFGRFEDTSEHRMAGYQTTWNILSNNLLGVGADGMEKALLNNASYGFLTNLKTIDNFYLTQIAKYGILSLLTLPFYFCYPFIAFRKSMKNKYYRTIVFLFFPWAILGFSFSVDSYISVSLLFFGIAGHLFRIIENEQQYGFINNYRKLQYN